MVPSFSRNGRVVTQRRQRIKVGMIIAGESERLKQGLLLLSAGIVYCTKTDEMVPQTASGDYAAVPCAGGSHSQHRSSARHFPLI